MKDWILIVALTAVLASFLLGALSGALFASYGPADEVKVPTDVEPVKMAVAVLAPMRLHGAAVADYYLIGSPTSFRTAAGTHAASSFYAVLLC